MDAIKDSRKNKGLSYTIEERQKLGIHGLLPARILTQQEQVEKILDGVRRINEPLDKYVYLMHLLDRFVYIKNDFLYLLLHFY
jgi:malate dehydrogenase (oxaloacetate-decarboxylating)(NADP+)